MSRTRNRRRLVPEAGCGRKDAASGVRSNVAVSTTPHAVAEQISRPRAAEIPHRPGDDRRRGRAEPGEKAEPADIPRVALGKLRDQGLRARPGKANGRAVDELQQQQGPEIRRQRKQRRQQPSRSRRRQASPRACRTGPSTRRYGSTGTGRGSSAPRPGCRSRAASRPERQAVKRDQKGEEIDIAHAERSGHIERGGGRGPERAAAFERRRGTDTGRSSSPHLAMPVCWAAPDCRAAAKAARCRAENGGRLGSTMVGRRESAATAAGLGIAPARWPIMRD